MHAAAAQRGSVLRGCVCCSDSSSVPLPPTSPISAVVRQRRHHLVPTCSGPELLSCAEVQEVVGRWQCGAARSIRAVTNSLNLHKAESDTSENVNNRNPPAGPGATEQREVCPQPQLFHLETTAGIALTNSVP